VKSAECRKRAQECVELAQTARDTDRPKYLQLAKQWLQLADDAVSYEAEHPVRPAARNPDLARAPEPVSASGYRTNSV